MKKERLLNAIGQIDEKLIADAFEEKASASAKKRNSGQTKKGQTMDCFGGVFRLVAVRRRDNSFCGRKSRRGNGNDGNQSRSGVRNYPKRRR